ncbi:MAG: ABC transporter ATP-binding protein [Bradyrhizobium sp.]|uniref:ABC transporter ATP-binding protein n=1 Tax=Bradyrhizobium sp. TaxID=376 RepID=UPI001DA68DD8|nr:ABC transporter ATP-binding protein [Bradyrhizobium sp.]MBV9564833.1 ABC transporter ATP-binding protein [Bradyrhizobium sp.]
MPEPLLEVHGLDAFYGDFQALFGVSMRVATGAIVAVIGANGAGKSTLLKSIAGLMDAQAEAIRFDGVAIGGGPAYRTVARGIALVPEGRRLFPSLTVEENLLIGGHGRKVAGPWSLERVYGLFPVLKQRRASAATTLSGGQQQMAAIGRALMSNPRLLLCDEISLGLAPIVIADIYASLAHIKAEGTSVILVEQDIVQAMKASDRVYCFQEGRLSLSGRPQDLTRDAIHRAYFGG